MKWLKELVAKVLPVLRRIWHMCLMAVGLAIPLVAAWSDSTGELGKYGKPGIVAIALIGIAVNVSHTWKPPADQRYKRWLARIGTAANLASPVMTMVYTNLPPGTKHYLFLGTVCALAGSWKGAFGPLARKEAEEDEQPAPKVVPLPVPPAPTPPTQP